MIHNMHFWALSFWYPFLSSFSTDSNLQYDSKLERYTRIFIKDL